MNKGTVRAINVGAYIVVGIAWLYASIEIASLVDIPPTVLAVLGITTTGKVVEKDKETAGVAKSVEKFKENE